MILDKSFQYYMVKYSLYLEHNQVLCWVRTEGAEAVPVHEEEQVRWAQSPGPDGCTHMYTISV